MLHRRRRLPQQHRQVDSEHCEGGKEGKQINKAIGELVHFYGLLTIPRLTAGGGGGVRKENLQTAKVSWQACGLCLVAQFL